MDTDAVYRNREKCSVGRKKERKILSTLIASIANHHGSEGAGSLHATAKNKSSCLGTPDV
jgi:hypothetical protein